MARVSRESLTTGMTHSAPLTRATGTRRRTGTHWGPHHRHTHVGSHTITPQGSHPQAPPAPWASPSPPALSPGRSSPRKVSHKPGSSPQAVLPAPYSSATGWGPEGVEGTPQSGPSLTWGLSRSPCLPPTHIQHPAEGWARLQPILGKTAAISDQGDRAWGSGAGGVRNTLEQGAQGAQPGLGGQQGAHLMLELVELLL